MYDSGEGVDWGDGDGGECGGGDVLILRDDDLDSIREEDENGDEVQEGGHVAGRAAPKNTKDEVENESIAMPAQVQKEAEKNIGEEQEAAKKQTGTFDSNRHVIQDTNESDSDLQAGIVSKAHLGTAEPDPNATSTAKTDLIPRGKGRIELDSPTCTNTVVVLGEIIGSDPDPDPDWREVGADPFVSLKCPSQQSGITHGGQSPIHGAPVDVQARTKEVRMQARREKKEPLDPRELKLLGRLESVPAWEAK